MISIPDVAESTSKAFTLSSTLSLVKYRLLEPSLKLSVSKPDKLETVPVTLPSKFATIVPAVPLNTSALFVASGIKVNLPVLSSKPKKPTLAPEPV